jgi:hypothetical protein
MLEDIAKYIGDVVGFKINFLKYLYILKTYKLKRNNTWCSFHQIYYLISIICLNNQKRGPYFEF